MKAALSILLGLSLALFFTVMFHGWQFAAVHFENGQAYVHSFSIK
jgi:hypothetical protein